MLNTISALFELLVWPHEVISIMLNIIFNSTAKINDQAMIPLSLNCLIVDTPQLSTL